jgi:DNA modification methylase
MGGSDEEKHDHPTQKPVELMRRPIVNHLKRGEPVYSPTGSSLPGSPFWLNRKPL